MGVIRTTDARHAALRPTPLNLGDLARQGDELVTRARDRADEVVAEAKAEREQLIEGASERGFEQGREAGFAEGVEAGREQGRREALDADSQSLQKLQSAWLEALERFNEDRVRLLSATRDDLIRLAALVAERVTHRAVALRLEGAAPLAEAVMRMVASSTRLSLVVHPDDRASLERALPDLLSRFTAIEHAELETDPNLVPGSCVGRTAAGGVLDASIGVQIDRLVMAMLPGDGSTSTSADALGDAFEPPSDEEPSP
ncbi:MAG: FliH/SctL family protein [Planctomycetota bacterium]